MTAYELVFSSKGSIRSSRHIAFWGLYVVYFFVQSIVPISVEDFSKPQTYLDALVSVLCFVPVCVLFVYTCIHILLPRYLQKGRYGMFLLSFLVLCLLGEFLNYFMAGFFFHFARAPWTGTEITAVRHLDLGTVNTIWALLIGVIAIGIKLSKQWYSQLQDNLAISQKKVLLNLNFQKSKIQPEFLFRSLANIHTKIHSGSASSSRMILNLSDFLSYTLYQQNEKLGLVKNEIEAIRNLISLEKNAQDTRTEIQCHIHNLDQNRLVPPQILLSLVLDSLHAITGGGILMITLGSNAGFLEAQLIIHGSNGFNSEMGLWKNILHHHKIRFSQFFSTEEYKIALRFTDDEIIINLEFALNSGDIPALLSV